MTTPSSAASQSTLNVLLIGGGGREHAIAEHLARSPRLNTLYATHTKNPGIAKLAKPVDVPVNIKEIYRLISFCDKHNIHLVVIGPEDPLAEGYRDALETPTRLVFGPTKEGAKLEADKAWAKQLMRSASIPTADSRSFSNAEQALDYVRSRREPPVVKAAGLAKGKGVIVAGSTVEAVQAIERIMKHREFGDAGNTVLIEERLTGPEVSVLALVDGRNIYVLETAQDHKRLLDGDKGPNTGGMGAFTPSPTLSQELLEEIQREIIVPTIDALRRDGIVFQGVLYTGLMLTPAGPKVLEYNVRFGDPECQAILARLNNDLLEVIIATCTGTLDQIDLDWKPGASACIVLAAPGYPDKPEPGAVIRGIEDALKVDNVRIYHAGTTMKNAEITATGGRVLNVVATAETPEQAADAAYRAINRITFPGVQFRTDIARSVPAIPAAKD